MPNTRRHHLNHSRQQQVRRMQIFEWQKQTDIDQPMSQSPKVTVQNQNVNNTQAR